MAWASHNSYLGNKEEEEEGGREGGGWIKKKKDREKKGMLVEGVREEGSAGFVCSYGLCMQIRACHGN